MTDGDRQDVEWYLYEKYLIPEPSALVLLVIGLVFLGLLRRRRLV